MPDTDTTKTPAADPAVVTTAVTDVQSQMGRVDTKASMLLAGSITALSVGVAVVAKAKLPTAATVTAVLCLVLIGAAVALLITAIRPALGGNHGFVRWANTTSPADLLADPTLTDQGRTLHLAQTLRGLSLSVLRKYRTIRLAVDLIRVALAVAALTALLAVV